MTATPASEACSERREMEFIYQDGDGFVFLDAGAGALVTLPHERAGVSRLYLKEGARVHLLFHQGQPCRLEPPTTVQLTVTDTEPPLPAAAAPKPAVLETGLKIVVPAFIAVGDMVRVDTRSGTYLGKVLETHAAG